MTMLSPTFCMGTIRAGRAAQGLKARMWTATSAMVTAAESAEGLTGMVSGS